VIPPVHDLGGALGRPPPASLSAGEAVQFLLDATIPLAGHIGLPSCTMLILLHT